MRPGTWLLVTSLALGGCQTFVGIDDVAGHLPYVDGEYLIGLQRREADGDMPIIRLRGTATLDPDTRTLALSLSQLSATTGATVSENGISDLVFADDATAVEFDLSIEIRPEATEPPTAGVDSTVSARMRVKLEGDYAICAESVAGGLPKLGSVLIAPGEATPALAEFDADCDGL
ncbi:MAG: hypothetical protein IPH44_37605 [Myxococcales bacterium]|nr:hypothetical protein [Myxococcales bacterium]MBK7190888.1 hypothetical protein [Myxococcales bacterium]MBP6847377.1 hypothetical protein [Kofleriaceae bacterium]